MDTQIDFDLFPRLPIPWIRVIKAVLDFLIDPVPVHAQGREKCRKPILQMARQ